MAEVTLTGDGERCLNHRVTSDLLVFYDPVFRGYLPLVLLGLKLGTTTQGYSI